ncbi:hypothetical protein CYLTODRAFT_469021 [Cylindrobasidium torrendii FP15055 ss-10]|uniref:Uncharacterized protein n=1 Tax=Cylindrobasidium torrendii FP15055 ss-10 TaxID=1314674 RepID=A0A0D7BQ79_9AGAR|nr:hypothetical protein CYLTODRAFT_469021 [Cylindrobasidium torrendii FP15055 ss-10]
MPTSHLAVSKIVQLEGYSQQAIMQLIHHQCATSKGKVAEIKGNVPLFLSKGVPHTSSALQWPLAFTETWTRIHRFPRVANELPIIGAQLGRGTSSVVFLPSPSTSLSASLASFTPEPSTQRPSRYRLVCPACIQRVHASSCPSRHPRATFSVVFSAWTIISSGVHSLKAVLRLSPFTILNLHQPQQVYILICVCSHLFPSIIVSNHSTTCSLHLADCPLHQQNPSRFPEGVGRLLRLCRSLRVGDPLHSHLISSSRCPRPRLASKSSRRRNHHSGLRHPRSITSTLSPSSLLPTLRNRSGRPQSRLPPRLKNTSLSLWTSGLGPNPRKTSSPRPLATPTVARP